MAIADRHTSREIDHYVHTFTATATASSCSVNDHLSICTLSASPSRLTEQVRWWCWLLWHREQTITYRASRRMVQTA